MAKSPNRIKSRRQFKYLQGHRVYDIERWFCNKLVPHLDRLLGITRGDNNTYYLHKRKN